MDDVGGFVGLLPSQKSQIKVVLAGLILTVASNTTGHPLHTGLGVAVNEVIVGSGSIVTGKDIISVIPHLVTSHKRRNGIFIVLAR